MVRILKHHYQVQPPICNIFLNKIYSSAKTVLPRNALNKLLIST